MTRYTYPADPGWVGPGPTVSLWKIPDGFFHFKSSEGRPHADEWPGIHEIYDYLEHVYIGLQGRPLCPFVERVHQGDGYHVKLYTERANRVPYMRICQELRKEFHRLSPAVTHAGQGLDITAVVAAFCDEGCRLPSFGKRLEGTRNHHRQSFLDKGLMLAHMFDGHPDTGGNRGYNSRIPLLIVRRMHQPDIVFMKKPEELVAYRKFFPE